MVTFPLAFVDFSMQPFQLQSSNCVAISGDMESFTLAAACFQFMLLAAAAGVAVIVHSLSEAGQATIVGV